MDGDVLFLVVTGSNTFLQLSELLWYLKVTNMGMHLMPFFVVSVSSHSLFWCPFSVKLA